MVKRYIYVTLFFLIIICKGSLGYTRVAQKPLELFDLTVDFLKVNGPLIKSQRNSIRIKSGTAGTWILTLECLKALDKGSKITIFRYNFQIANQLQKTHNSRRDYVSIDHNADAEIDMHLLNRARGIELTIKNGKLKKNDKIVIKIGDCINANSISEVFWSATRGRLGLFMDVNGETVKIAKDMFVDVVCRTEPKCLRLLGPTIIDRSERFSLNLVVFDINRNVVDSFGGTVIFDAPEGISGLPQKYTFKPADKGIKIFSGISISKTGIFRISVSLENSLLKTRSNPLICKDNPDERIFWGDLHSHAWGDDAMFMMYDRNEKIDPFTRHKQARSVGRYDYAAPAAMAMPDTPERSKIWQVYLDAYDKSNETGKYVPFIAMELHPGYAGDRTLIFKNRETEVPISCRPTSTVEDVYEKYGDRKDAILETHIGGYPPNFDEYKPENVKMVEVASGFGNAEWLLQMVLQGEFYPAVTGASDVHLGLSGAPRAVETFRGRFGKYLNVRDSGFGAGPAGAVIADRCERNSIWKSLMERKSYATSSDRIYLNLDADGFHMGQIADIGECFNLNLSVSGQELIERIDLMVGTYLAKSLFPDKLDISWDIWFDRHKMPPGKWFYFRVKQTNSEYAWTAPVWFKDKKEIGDN
ncbi:MAG: hypothetical protein ACYSSI_11885, partial [Planctomycetota bacterium]